MKRPLGVWIIGILAIIGAVLRILAALTALGVSGLAMTGTLGEETGGLGGRSLTIGIVMLIIGVLYLIFAISFIGLRAWAWAAMMFIQLLAIAAVIAQFVLDGFHGATLVGIIIPLIIVIYLTRPGVRKAFAR